MRTIEVITTGIDLTKVKPNSAKLGEKLDTRDLMELTLDMIPQGGFTPKDIKDRNRIQDAIDKSRADNLNEVLLEDADYENFIKIVSQSRWVTRDKDVQAFLDKYVPKE